MPMIIMRRGIFLTTLLCLASETHVGAFSAPSRLPRPAFAGAVPAAIGAGGPSPRPPRAPTVARWRGGGGGGRSSPLSSSPAGGSEADAGDRDDLVRRTSGALRRTSWISWWAQVILTTVSAVILLFARNIGQAASTTPGRAARGAGGFFFAGTGIALSVMSIFWTWGGARLSRRLLRDGTSRISAANLTRRAVKVGATINLLGMFVTLMGAFIIIGELATKVLTSQGVNPFGAGGIAAAAVAAQTIQPLDILVVQANANTLLSHYASLFLVLFLTRFVDKLDPPSMEDDPRD